MASISSLGTGSGIDLEGMITKLMTVERAPLTAINKREASYQANITALGSLKGALSSLQTAASTLAPGIGQSASAKIATYQATVADTTIASVTASSTAVAGSYTLEVSALATAQQQSLNNLYAATDKVLDPAGGNTLTLTKGSGASATTTTVSIDSATATLADLRDAINKSGAGVSAVIVTDADSKQHLQLTATDTGTANAVTLSGVKFAAPSNGADGSAVDASAAFTVQNATDAAAKINGISVATSGNTLTNAVDGLTIKLLKTNTGSPTTISVTRDTAPLRSNLNTLVRAFNDLNSTMASLGSYDPNTKVAGALNGDSTLRTAQSQVRGVLSSVPNALAGAAYRSLGDIGITLDKTGALSIDNAKLQKAIDNNFTAVANVVGTYSSSFKTVTDNLLGVTGSIATRTSGINSMVASLDKQRDALSVRLTAIEKQYRAQFTALDSAIASMQNTSSYLTQQLTGIANITNYNSNK